MGRCLGEGIGYNFLRIFFFFLTNIVGIMPATAGFISLVAIVWDGVSGHCCYLSDNSAILRIGVEFYC